MSSHLLDLQSRYLKNFQYFSCAAILLTTEVYYVSMRVTVKLTVVLVRYMFGFNHNGDSVVKI